MKRLTIIILVVVIIGIGFYLGYQQSVKVRYPEEIKNTYTQLIQTFRQKPKGTEQESLLAFISQYTLAPNENLKYISPPYLKGRDVYYRYKIPAQAKVIPQGPNIIYLYWKDEHTIESKAMTFGKPNITDVLKMIAGVHTYEIEGNQTILNKGIEGDFIFRENVSQEELFKDLEKICFNQLHQSVKFEFQDVPRSVYIARRTYRFHPLSGRGQQVEVYGETLGPQYETGDQSGDFQKFMVWLGEQLHCQVISEVENPPSQKLRWRYYYNENLSVKPELVVQHITEQTGLTFTEEIRTVKVLFIE